MFVIAAPTASNDPNVYFIGAAVLKNLGWSYTGATHLANAKTFETFDAAEAELSKGRVPAGFVVRAATPREQVILRHVARRVAFGNSRDWSFAGEDRQARISRRLGGAG